MAPERREPARLSPRLLELRADARARWEADKGPYGAETMRKALAEQERRVPVTEEVDDDAS
jgi:hypothetical protein